MRPLIYITVLLVFSSCAATKNYTQDDILFSMKKTSCYGPCPVYEMKIYKNGFVKLTAEEHLDLKGEFYTKLPGSKVKTLISIFKEAGFFEMEGQYTSIIKDLPTTWIFYSNEGRQKRIKDYDGAPESLKDLEKELSSLLESEDWKKK
ncbi:MAG: hypothetical protein J7K53_00090 [Bacteroidales bacterium]|nr:hypothetical protein [Bacteroidales bacterium]